MNQLEKDLTEAAKIGDFLTTVQKASLDQAGNRDLVGEAIAALHNQGKIDCLSEFKKLTNGTKGSDFFLTRNVFEHALPNINAPVEQVMDCVQHLVSEAGNDMAAGWLYNPFIEYCEADTDRPSRTLNLATNIEKDYLDFISPAIVAGSKSDLPFYLDSAIELTFHNDQEIQLRALFSLSRIDFLENQELAEKALSAIEKVVEKNNSDQLLGTALKSAFSIYSAIKYFEDRLLALSENIIINGGDFVLHAVSEVLAFEKGKAPENLLILFVDALKSFNTKNKGTLDNIDHGLRHLISSKAMHLVTELIEPILIKNYPDLSIESFDGFIREVYRDDNQCLNYLVTRWLLSKKISLCKAVFLIINQNHGNDVLLKADLDQFSDEPPGTYLFAVRKSIGWLVTNPIAATSYIISLLTEASDDEAKEISHLLFDPLLINHREKVEEFLKTSLSSCQSREKELIENAIKKSDEYYECLNSIEEIPELHPSTSNREAHLRLFNRQMSESYKEAQKDSIVNLIVNAKPTPP